jgi:hypothetical protein
MRLLRLAVAVLVALLVLPGSAAFGMFRASHLVVVPVASSLTGLNSSNWHTDLEIQNVDTVPIDVLIIFLPSTSIINAAWYANLSNHLSGRTEDGFGKTDTSLENIPAGHAVYLNDVIRTNWSDGVKGALLVFAYQAGTYKTTTPPGGVPALIVVRSRTYSLGQTTGGSPTTYGQSIPGLPWYYAIDPMLESKGLNQAVFSGVREDSQYRTAFGFLNISDVTTSIWVQSILTASDGTVLKTVLNYMYPLEHEQYDQAAYTLFGLDSATALTNATVTVKVSAWQSAAATPKTGLIVYGSRIDNTTNDPVYLEQTYVKELPWDCVFNGNCSAAQALSAPHAGVFRQSLLPPAPAR